MRKFEIPEYYRSPVIAEIKRRRKDADPRKVDYTPTLLDFGSVAFRIARHFGFCFGVENAIETAYRIIDENPDKRIFLISEMIHNPGVNNDLKERGVRFIKETDGTQIIPWEELNANDVVIVPAFGTTLETEAKLKEIGLDTERYDTTCPFVERVWNRAATLGDGDYTVIIHGKAGHEETRATFSHSAVNGKSLIVRNIDETKFLADAILGKIPEEEFYRFFAGRMSESFDFKKDLEKVGVVNQTTMLASETEAIAEYLKAVMIEKYGEKNLNGHFADARDTLCYATNDNQKATLGLLNADSDFAIVVGGYNSSNTTHIVELLEEKFPVYFIASEKEIISEKEIEHFDIHSKKILRTKNYLPDKKQINIALTSGASCPDSVVDRVMLKLLSFFEADKTPEEALNEALK